MSPSLSQRTFWRLLVFATFCRQPSFAWIREVFLTTVDTEVHRGPLISSSLRPDTYQSPFRESTNARVRPILIFFRNGEKGGEAAHKPDTVQHFWRAHDVLSRAGPDPMCEKKHSQTLPSWSQHFWFGVCFSSRTMIFSCICRRLIAVVSNSYLTLGDCSAALERI